MLAVAGAFGVSAVIMRFGPFLAESIRAPVATILGLAAICTSVALLMNPVADTQRPMFHLDGPTIVRSADRRDSGLIVATIDDVVMQNMGWTEAHRQRWARETASIALGQMGLLVITTTESHRPIGVISLASTDDPTMATIGMWLGAAGRNHGHMRRALTLVADDLCARGWSFRAETAAENEGSKKSFEGAGFEQIGWTAHRLPNGVDVDALIYARYAGASSNPGRRTVAEPTPDPAGNGGWAPPAV